jgi:hypothetical protein
LLFSTILRYFGNLIKLWKIGLEEQHLLDDLLTRLRVPL